MAYYEKHRFFKHKHSLIGNMHGYKTASFLFHYYKETIIGACATVIYCVSYM